MTYKMTLSSNKILILITFLLLAVLSPAFSDSAIASNGLSHKNKISVQVAYAHPISTEFRDTYGANWHFSSALHRQIIDKFGLKFSMAANRNEADEFHFKFRELAGVLSPTYTISYNENVHFLLTAGMGLSRRQVKTEIFRGAIVPQATWITQRETTTFIELSGGIEYLIINRIANALIVSYNHYLSSDPSIGKFGNTGGLRFGLSFGFVF